MFGNGSILFFFKDNRKHFLFCYWASMLEEETKGDSSAVSCHIVLYILTISPPPAVYVTSPLFTKCHFFNLTCVFFCWLLHKLHSFVLFFFLRLPQDFRLFKYCENISLGGRERRGSEAMHLFCSCNGWTRSTEDLYNLWCLPSNVREQRYWEEFLKQVLKCILWVSIKINL